MDDESYFTKNGHDFCGNDRFYMDDKQKITVVRYRRKEKFSTKLYVWLAISPCGCPKSFFVSAECALNAEIDSKHCIKDRSVSFLKKNYPDNNYIFWSDGASSHYAKKAVDLFKKLDIRSYQKLKTLPVPQLHPIEDLWAILKRRVYAEGWEANDLDRLKNNLLHLGPKSMETFY